MKITRRFTKPGADALASVEYEKRTSRISNPDGSIVFEMNDAEIPKNWSQLATDIMVSKYFRKAGVPLVDESGQVVRDSAGKVVTGSEKSARQVVHRLAGCWRHWGETHGYFDSAEDAQAFYDEIAYMLLHQMCAPNSPQWFNTGLNWAYGITGPAQGHLYCDPMTGALRKSSDAYSHPQPHACFIQSVSDDLVNDGGIMDLWTREARLFKYGSGTGSNFSRLRGENEALSGGGKSSGLMSFLKIGDRAAGAIKSGGTTRRAAKMVCLDLDHPDIEDFINWKVREEIKVAAMAEGMKHLPREQQETAKKLKLKLDYDFNGEAYLTVSGQNSNNSIRIPNSFFKALEDDGDWKLYRRTDGKVAKTLKARELWDEIAYAAWRCADPGVQYDTTINQWHTCPKSGPINASNPCVTGDTRVLTPGGIWRRIDQMIHLPSRVITNLDRQEIHVTDGAFPTGTRDVYELRTVGGYSVKLTADHKVWTRGRGWVAAKDLESKDEIRLPHQPACVHEVGEPQDAQFFQLLGLFLSGANGGDGVLRLDAVLPESAQRDQFSQYVANVWGNRESCSTRSGYRDDYVNEVMMDGGSPIGDIATALLPNKRLMNRLRAFARMGGTTRGLGDEAFTAGLAAQKHLLRGLFTADGVFINGTIELRSNHAGLLHDVQLLLLGFGIQSALVGVDAAPALSDANRGASLRAWGDFELGTRTPSQRPSGGSPDRRVTNLPGRRPGDDTFFSEGQVEPGPRGDAESKRHGLRIDPGSLRSFAKHIGLLPGRMLRQLADATPFALSPTLATGEPCGNYDRVASLTPLGRQQVFDLTEPSTSSFIANGLTVHNCSEYMFLDDTACNLASLNVLTFFDPENRRFDLDGYRHGIRLWTIVLEISVLMASFPSEAIARRSYKFRTLGLGYANLGAMLMQAGVPYDSEKGRAVCAALTSVLTGESYATSAEMAAQLGSFAGYFENKADMLRVIRNHRRAAYDITHDSRGREAIGNYESLDIKPVGIDASQFGDSDPLAPRAMLSTARECWDRALAMGQQHGYRNAQTTVIAPTGTIGLLMDCDTTGVEPDFALVKFKKLAGGGYFKIANQSLAPALRNLGYEDSQIHEILQHVMGTLTLHGAPHLEYHRLLGLGFTEAELNKVEAALPGTFEIGFAFNPWALGPEAMKRLDIPEEQWQSPGFNLLRHLGFSRKQINEANDRVCGCGTVEGAPYLRTEHYPVFDCANKCGKLGKRFIPVEGHIRMMAAAQPFITGAISKTINLPNEANTEDIKNSYRLSWELGLKANALYRDGSKLSQPLNVKSDEELEKTEEDDAEAVSAAREEVAHDVARATVEALKPIVSDNVTPVHSQSIERIVERIVERPLRRRLPDTRRAMTHKFDVAGHEGYITVGLYEDGQPGEVFIRIAKEGSTIGGLMDTIATLVSVSLQYGVPVESLVRKFEHVRFEPSGMTRNPEIPIAKSLVDYIFRWMAMEFVPGYRAANAPKRPSKQPAPAVPGAPSEFPISIEQEPSSSGMSSKLSAPASAPVTKKKPGNGHHPRMEADTAKSFAYESDPLDAHAAASDQSLQQAHSPHNIAPEVDPAAIPSGPALRLAIVADPLSQQGTEMQADAPACDVCGSITVRSGTCYKCLNCGNSMGCS